MVAKFDEDKYKKIFEQRFGTGSYDSGLSNARKIGQLKAQAEIAKQRYNDTHTKSGKLKKSYNDAAEYWKSADLGGKTPYQMEQEIRNDPSLQQRIKDEGYSSIDDYIDGLYAGTSGGKYRSSREYGQHITEQNKRETEEGKKRKQRVKERDELYENEFGYTYQEFLKNQQQKAKETIKEETPKKQTTTKTNKTENKNFLGKAKDFFTGKDTDGDGDRDGLLGFLDSTLGRASKAAQKTVLGEDFIKKQDETYNKRATETNNKPLQQMQTTIQRKPQNALEKGSDITGSILGEVGPYALGYGIADKSLKIAKGLNSLNKLTKNPIAREFARGSIAGGVVGTGKAVVRDTFSDDYGVKDYAKQIGGEALIGGGTDAALSTIFKIIKSVKGAKNTVQPSANMVDAAPTENIVKTNTQTFKMPEQPLQLPAPQQPLKNKLQNNWVDFGLSTKNEPKPRYRYEQPKQNQQYWQTRYEDFAKQINDNYDMNQMTPEALEDLWTQFAKYDEPYTLDQVIDLAYPKGFEPKQAVKTVDEAVNMPKQEVQNKKPEDILQPLQFRRLAGGMEKQFIPNNNKIESSLDRLKGLGQQLTTNQSLLDPLSKIKNQQVTPNRNVLDPLRKIQAPQTVNQESLLGPLKVNKTVSEAITPSLNKLTKLKQVQPQQTGGTADTFRSKVNRKPVKSSKVKEFMENARTQFVDDLAPLEKLEKNVRGTVNSAEDSLYKQGRLYRGSTEKANEIFETQLSPILKSIEKEGFSVEDLGDYALAVHAKDVNAKGINSGFTNDEINAVINKFNKPAMENARKELMDLNDSLLNNLAESGVVSKQSTEQMRKKYPNYMPLFRSFDDEKVDFATGLSKALSVGSSPIKKLEGSSRDVVDPIESVVKNIFQLTSTADRNRVARQLGSLAKEDTAENFVRRLNPGEEAGRKNVISAMENGEKVQYEVPPEVYKAMKNLDKESSSMLIKLLQKPASTLRAGATLTPEFSLRNPMRDIVQAYIVSDSKFNPLIDFPVGLFQTALKGRSFKIAGKEFKAPDQLYRQFLQDNGGFGNIVSVDREMNRKAIEEVLKSNDKRFINIVNPKAWLNVLRSIADVSETATKVGEYRAALRSGASRQEAAYRARDIMDFARAGVSIREANKVVAFLNANIQGKSKLIRAIQNNPWKVSVNSLKAVTLPTIGAFMAQQYLASDDQKRIIEDAPDWMKKSFWLLPVPGTEQVARIPKPFDVAPIFANLPEEMLDYLVKNDPEAFDKFGKETLASYTIPTMITGLIPFVEGMANYSFFREGPIIPQRENDLNYPEQYDVNTSETAKALGKGINALTGGEGLFKNFGSPRIVDNTIRGLTGGLGTHVTDAIDIIVEGTGMVKDVESPKKDILTELTPLKAFLVNQNSTGESINKLYNLKDKLTRERGSAKENGEPYPQGLYKQVNKATETIGDISKKIREIENSPTLSGEEKRRRIEELNKKRNEYALKQWRSLKIK